MTDTIQDRLRSGVDNCDTDRRGVELGGVVLTMHQAAAHIDAQDAKIKALVEALGRLVKTYSNMEDGDGEPCPDVANAISTLAAAKETTP